MLTIACLSQKGGVGKSTLTRLIARTYAEAGWRVKIADFNTKQKTSVDWAATRLQAGLQPEIAAEVFASLKPALAQDYDLMVFDGKPDADTQTIELAKEARLVVIPTSTSLDDLSPQVKFAHELRQRGIGAPKILFVLNKSNDSTASIKAAREYIGHAGYDIARGEIASRVSYEVAQNTGRALSESDYEGLNDRANAIAQQIVDRATKLTGG